METTIRKMILESAYYAKHGHMPSALCIVEIMCAYDKIRTSNDEFILSKGHGCLAYYAYLVEKGLLQFEELKSFGKKGSRLGGHPDKNKVPERYFVWWEMENAMKEQYGNHCKWQLSLT